MELGIFSRTFQNDSLELICKKMALYGIQHTQFNLSCAQMETMPKEIAMDKLEEIHRLCQKYDIHIDAISGTFNMIAPDLEEREDGCRRFQTLCQIAKELKIPIVSVCTGSKNPESKWKWHNDNSTQAAWDDLLRTTEKILKSATQYDCMIGVEIEASNIINSAALARKYFDVFKTEHLKIIMDGANLFSTSQIGQQEEILDETFELVGKEIVLAHVKDLSCEENITFTAAGEGILDYSRYLTLLHRYGYTGTLIMHELEERQILGSIRFLEGKLHELF